MSNFDNNFESKWEELFKDVGKLNEYTLSNQIELNNVKVNKHDIDGAIFIAAKFKGVEWVSTRGQNSSFTKTVFENCNFTLSDFSESTLIDVVFNNCTFNDVDINKSKLINVYFNECSFNQMGLVENTGDILKFRKCKLLNSGLGDSTIDFEFQECELDGVDLSVTKNGGRILIVGGWLSEVDLGDSFFSDVILRRVKQGEGGVKFNSVTAKSISFEDVEMLKGIGMGWANVALVRIVGGKLYGPAFKEANIAKTVIRDAYVTRFATGHMGKVEVANSTLHRSGLFEGEIQEFSVVNSTIDEIVGKNFKADTVLWDNVTLSGKIDLTNAQVQDFRPTRIQRGPDLQLITTGSNMNF